MLIIPNDIILQKPCKIFNMKDFIMKLVKRIEYIKKN